jgi:L-iditol 2-dehydrogenase
MRQALIQSPTRFLVEEVASPQLRADDEMIVRTAACGICSGDLMEWYLKRKVNTVLGHEVVGYAAEVGPALSHARPGQLVFVHHHAPCGDCRFCRAGDPVHCPTWRATRLDPGGMAEFIRVPGANARADSFAIDDLAPEVGVFIEPLACSVKALARAGAERHQVGAIVGCGVMGLLNLAAARALGTRTLWAIEPDPERARLARDFGADEVFHPDDLLARAAEPAFEGADYVVVGPGIPEVVLQSVRYVRSGGTVVLFTPTPDGATTTLDLGDMYFREISLVPSYSCGPADTRRAYKLLQTGKVRVDRLVTHRFRLDQIQRAYDTAKRGGSALKVLVVFDGEKP